MVRLDQPTRKEVSRNRDGVGDGVGVGVGESRVQRARDELAKSTTTAQPRQPPQPRALAFSASNLEPTVPIPVCTRRKERIARSPLIMSNELPNIGNGGMLLVSVELQGSGI